MKYCILTYGCQMNKSDSEKIARRLKNAGHKPAKNAKRADIIAVNFCSVRQSAVHRALAQLDKYKNKQLIAAGCLLPNDQKKLTDKKIEIWRPDDYFTDSPLRASRFSAFVPIMTGCDNFCSYCAVPFTRGREKSRPTKEIIAEIKKLLKTGVKEIVLLGQNVNSYESTTDYGLRTTAKESVSSSFPFEGEGCPPRLASGEAGGEGKHSAVDGSRWSVVDFPHLLQLINSLPGDFHLTFISSHPKDMSDKLIATCAKCAKISPYIHLPVQSGDNKILQAMNRHYSVAHYKNLIKKLRLAFKKYRSPFPPLAISTDIIVGFPGETAKQFQNTLKLIKDVKFDMIYFARYSPRSSTAAAKLKDDVPPKEKMRRAQAINSLLKQQALAINKKYVNQEVDVLIEKIEKEFAFGKTATDKSVRVSNEKLKLGQFIKVRIIGATAWGLNAITAD